LTKFKSIKFELLSLNQLSLIWLSSNWLSSNQLSSNGLISYWLSSNRLSLNRLSSNRLSSNRLSLNRLSLNWLSLTKFKIIFEVNTQNIFWSSKLRIWLSSNFVISNLIFRPKKKPSSSINHAAESLFLAYQIRKKFNLTKIVSIFS